MSDKKEVVLELVELSKKFPGVLAVDNLSLRIYSGEIHGLIGENGSGKSTTVKCISGVMQPSNGNIYFAGEQLNFQDPMTRRDMGIATIFQEFSLVPTLTVAENIFLGRLSPKSKIVDWGMLIRKTNELLGKFKIEIDPQAVVGDLSVARQQMVEIAKALSINSKLIIMDEPTAAIGVTEAENLHRLIKLLASQGCAILYISHYIDDVIDVSDTISILRDGKLVSNLKREKYELTGIVRQMIGTNIDDHYPKIDNRDKGVLMKVTSIRTDQGVNGVSFKLHRGEVLGLAGLIGSGRTEIARAIFGIDQLKKGSIKLYNNSKTSKKGCFKNPREAINSGIALVTENRKEDGLFMNFNGAQNMTIASLETISRFKFLDLKKEREISSIYIEKMGIDQSAGENSVKSLSGGNQQKVVISRWLFSEADIFILDEPTRGIDVGAKVEVYKLINELTGKGKGIILISSEFPELISMSDRICIINKGKISEVVKSSKLNKYTLMQKCV